MSRKKDGNGNRNLELSTCVSMASRTDFELWPAISSTLAAETIVYCQYHLNGRRTLFGTNSRWYWLMRPAQSLLLVMMESAYAISVSHWQV